MRFDLDKVFGVHQQALGVHSRRAEILAGNLANAETPGFKARDIDFKAALQQVKGTMDSAPLMITNARHLNSAGTTGGRIDEVLGEMKYRTATQPSVDGNTVDPLEEKSAFMENALLYQTSLKFLSDKMKGIKKALKGE